MSKNITITSGLCAVETEQQVMDTAYKTSLVRDVAKPYGIDFNLRGGAWKPRTTYWDKSNGGKERVFEGVGEIGLVWLAQAAEAYKLPIVSELMSEMDIRHFGRHLEPERDYIQIGARTSQAFALLYAAGGTDFGVLLKNPQHGVNISEAVGSMERFLKNREMVYCTRGQMRFIHPNGEDPKHTAYMQQLLQDPNQHPDSRNLNNIGSIAALRANEYFQEKGIPICYDPSHTFGGKTNLMRRKIGEFAIKAVTEHGYDWIMVETNDRSRDAKCDKDQALLTTTNGIDWSETAAEEEPPADEMPITLVDIVKGIIKHQIDTGHVSVPPKQVVADYRRLDEIRWDMTA